MRLSEEKILILSILAYRPCKIRELIRIYSALNPRVYSNYHSLRVSVIQLLLSLRRNGYIIAKGRPQKYIYTITSKGIAQVVRSYLRKIIVLT